MKLTTYLRTIGALAIAGVTLSTTAVRADVTPGADFEADAGLDTDGDLFWEDVTGVSGLDLQLDDSPAVTRVTASTGTQLTHAYDFPGGFTGQEGGAIPVDAGTGTRRSFQDGPVAPVTDWSNKDVTIEIWVKPDFLTPANAANTNGQIVFEDGGGTGLGIFVDDSGELQLRKAPGGGLVAYNIGTDLSGLLLGSATTEFFQAVATYDVSAGAMEFFINGISVGTATPGGGDWSGGDDAGFGTRGANNTGGIGGGQAGTESLDGQIALIRIYSNQILTPAEVLANFDALSGPDLTPPALAADGLTPPDDTPDFFAGSNLSATFDEDVQALAGNINLVDLDSGSGNQSISISDTTQVTFSGDTITIDPAVNLLFATNYSVQIDGTAIGDIAATPNVFPGIIDTTTWNFTTDVEDTTAPLATMFSPDDDNTTVLPTTDLVVTFDEDIMFGTGDVILKNLTGSIDTTIDILDASQVSIAGNVLTINPTAILAGAANYAVQIEAGAIENLSGLPYAGIADNATWNFTTLEALLVYEPFDDLDPTLSGNTPGLGLSGSWGPGESSVTDGSLTYGRLAYQGGRAVTNPGDQFDVNGVSPGTTLTGAGLMDDGAELWFSVLIVKHADTSAATDDRRTYVTLGTGAPDGFDRIGGNTGSGFGVAVNKSNNAVEARGWNNNSDGGGGAFSGGLDTSVLEGDTFLAVGKITWGEFGVDNDVLELYLPDLDLNLGSPVSTLNANFDQLGTASAGNAFNTIGFAGGRPDNNVPEIDEIRFGATYGAVTPLDTTAPVLVATDNASGDGIQRVATFDEFVYAGTGDIRIVNETVPGTTTITLPDPQVVFSGNALTITPTGGLTGGNTYHIQIDPGAVEDRNLNDFPGIIDTTTWNFTVDGTPPTVASFGDDTFPLPVLTNSSLTYTVTFNEPMDVGTIDTTDFAGTSGSVPITVDSVSATGDPAIFDVAVSTLGTSGTLQLEIVQDAVITDVNGNALDTTTAIASDNTITVNDPAVTAASVAVDFQGTIGSENNPNGTGEARYFHVSVNPDNPGTGWYCANLPGSTTAAPSGVRNYTGPVVAYKFLGGTSNSITGVTGSGGEPERITYATEDASFDGFGQQQLRLWANNDPGADLATGAGLGAADFDSIGNFGYRSFGGAVGTIDISGLESGSLHIYYGAFSAVPSVKVTLKDTDNVAADIVLNDAHSVADGGNGDSANRTEYYLAEIDFVTDGLYDVIEYEWLANGTNYDGNGRGLGTVLTGPDVLGDYGVWAALYPGADLSDPDADFDGDGRTNGYERIFGLDPTTALSHDPIAVPFDDQAGTFSFTRRDDALTGLFSDIETSFDLEMWTGDADATLVVGDFDASTMIETVNVFISPGLLTAPDLFVRVNQNDGTIFSENFEGGDGNFDTSTTAGDSWEHGTPNSSSPGGSVIAGNGGSGNCWGTLLATNNGQYADSTVTKLRSTVIDLTGVAAAELLFAEALDLEAGDTAVVNIIDDTTDAIIAPAIYTADDSGASGDADWNNVGPIDLTPYVGQPIRIEWSFTGFGGGTDDYLGWYIDDVSVKKTP